MRCLLILAFFSVRLATAGWEVTATSVSGTLSKGAEVVRTELTDGGRNAILTAILFNTRTHALRVVDSRSPGSTRLAGELEAAGCEAGVNGGYFHGDFRPVGLVIADGRVIHPAERAKLLSGIVVVRGSGIEIVRTSRFKSPANVLQAIQCGPMLVENAAPLAGLNAERAARRTLIATDGRGRWALAYLTSVTLADAARILAIPDALAPGFVTATALNLDGGSSSGLWAASSPAVSLPEFGHVRNYLGISPKK
jgi:hypothetical protein